VITLLNNNSNKNKIVGLKFACHIVICGWEKIRHKKSIKFDLSKPDGVSRKLLNSSRLKSFGFKTKINLREGLIKSYQEFQNTRWIYSINYYFYW